MGDLIRKVSLFLTFPFKNTSPNAEKTRDFIKDFVNKIPVENEVVIVDYK